MASLVTYLLVIVLHLPLATLAQEAGNEPARTSFSGYLKYLQTVQLEKVDENWITDNIFHNRLNFKWDPSSKIVGRLEIRNRFYWGDDVKRIPNFKDLLQNRNEAMLLSFTTLASPTTVWHTNIERLWLEYRQVKWNVRAGRQRINWGFNSIWNFSSNDP